MKYFQNQSITINSIPRLNAMDLGTCGTIQHYPLNASSRDSIYKLRLRTKVLQVCLDKLQPGRESQKCPSYCGIRVIQAHFSRRARFLRPKSVRVIAESE